MKKLLVLSFFLLSFIASNAITIKNIWNINDSGAVLYVTKSSTGSPTVVNTFRISKDNVYLNTQNSYVYIKDVNGIIYQIKISTVYSASDDSVFIGGVAGWSGKQANAVSLIYSYTMKGYKNYASTVTTVATIKTGRGLLHTICIDSVGIGGLGTCTIWDGTSGADTTTAGVRLWSGTITAVGERLKDVKFNKGLYIKQKTTTAGRLNISYY